jgi:hypothetical protein
MANRDYEIHQVFSCPTYTEIRPGERVWL